MLWVYIIAAVGLVGIMVETWLSYRKEAAQMQAKPSMYAPGSDSTRRRPPALRTSDTPATSTLLN